MDLEVATPPVEESTPAAPAAEQPVKQPDDTLSIAEHRDKFSSPQDRLHPAPSRSRDDQTGRFVKGGTELADKATPQEKPATEKPIDAKAADDKKRHRERDVARPEDVPRIRELSAEVQRLRKQLETRTTPTPQPRPAPQPQARPTNGPANGNGGTDHWAFPKPEPKQVDFANADDPYAAWLEARQDWKLEKREWEASLQQQTSTAQETEQQFYNNFESKVRDFAQKTPEWTKVFTGDGPEHMRHYPPALEAMILMDDNPGELMYALGRDVALFDEVASWSEGIRIPAPTASEDERNAALAAVSRLRRMLDRRGLTGSSGSVPAPQAITVAPRPPNPLRTGPMRTGDEPPGDSGSMADHIRHFGRKNR